MPQQLAERDGLHRVPSFHRELVRGVADRLGGVLRGAARDAPPDVLFVPIGLGSGFAAAAAARAHCGVATRLVGVVSAHATAYLDSFRAGRPVDAPVTTLLADGMACRTPVPEALEVILPRGRRRGRRHRRGSGRRRCARCSPTPTTWPKARAPQPWRPRCSSVTRWQGKSIGIALTGGNVDAAMFAGVLAAR